MNDVDKYSFVQILADEDESNKMTDSLPQPTLLQQPSWTGQVYTLIEYMNGLISTDYSLQV